MLVSKTYLNKLVYYLRTLLSELFDLSWHYNLFALLNLLTWTFRLNVPYVLRLKVSLIRSNVIKSLMFRASLINLAMVEWLINLCQVGEVTNKSRLGGGVTSSLPCSEQHYKVSLVRSGLDLLYTLCPYCELYWPRVPWLPDIRLFMQWVVNTQVTSLVWAGLVTEWIHNVFALWTIHKDRKLGLSVKGFSYYLNRVYSPTIFIVDPFSLMHFRWSSVSFLHGHCIMKFSHVTTKHYVFQAIFWELNFVS